MDKAQRATFIRHRNVSENDSIIKHGWSSRSGMLELLKEKYTLSAPLLHGDDLQSSYVMC